MNSISHFPPKSQMVTQIITIYEEVGILTRDIDYAGIARDLMGLMSDQLTALLLEAHQMREDLACVNEELEQYSPAEFELYLN